MEEKRKKKITELYNSHGLPFQNWCFQTVRAKENYRAVTEFSFTYPSSSGSFLGHPGSVDIVAQHYRQYKKGVKFGGFTYLIIECKKANPKIKNWIFYNEGQNTDDYPIRPTFVVKPNLADESGMGSHIEVNSRLTFPQLGYENPDSFEYCLSGIEINEELTNLNRTQEENIYKSLLQLARGFRALSLRDPMTIENVEAENIDKMRCLPIVYLPVLVTTANLYLAKLKSGSMEDGGTALGGIEYESKEWLTYDFGLPDYLGDEAIGLEKQTIFIVNDLAWNSFLNEVTDIQGVDNE